MSVNIQSKEVLARLLATENITVIHDNVSTASFNVKDRVLKLPMWEDMQNFTYDHLVGHEVAHALYTGNEEWSNALKDKPEGYKSFLNVVEDARIEKLIQRKYPGLRRSFVQSYRKLIEDGFFGKSSVEVNTYDLIDRINVYFKCGASYGVKFSDDEKPWLSEIADAETFSEVEDITNRLYEIAKEQYDDEQQKQMQLQQELLEEEDDEGFQISEFDDKAEDGFEEESNETLSEKSEEDIGEDSYESENQRSGLEGVYQAKPDFGPYSQTDSNLSKNLHDNFKSDKTVVNFTIDVSDIPVIDCKQVLKDWNEYSTAIEKGLEYVKQFRVNNKKTINYLVKEFEMKKKATEYKRTTVSKTGVIDTLKMNNYHFSDDIFKKMSIVPEGKNHGLQMYIDWSGSMSNNLKDTIEQLLNLVYFCKQVNIPFQVFGFTDRYNDSYSTRYGDTNTIIFNEDFYLLEFFNHKMSRKEFNKASALLLSIANYWNRDDNYAIPYNYYLGGTPLNDAIISAMPLHDKFKKINRLDIVNIVFLTDGYGAGMKVTLGDDSLANPKINRSLKFCRNKYDKIADVINIKNPMNNTSYKFTTGFESTFWLKMLSDYTKANLIGFHILPNRRPSAISEMPVAGYSLREELWNDMIKKKFCLIPDFGFDIHFGVKSNNLQTSNGMIEVSENAKTSQIRNAFKKANKGRKESRIMLSKFIDMVA